MSLYHKLGNLNKMDFDISSTNNAPMIYPFWSNESNLRQN